MGQLKERFLGVDGVELDAGPCVGGGAGDPTLDPSLDLPVGSVYLRSNGDTFTRKPDGWHRVGDGFDFVQATPLAYWVIEHKLNRFPVVSVTDSTGRRVEVDVTYVDRNTVTISASLPFAGEAHLL